MGYVYSETLLDHFRNPRNAGELPPPAIVIEVSNPACGDRLRLSVRMDGDSAAEARLLARGCTASLAAGSALTELVLGCSREELSRITAQRLEEVLGGLAPESKHAAVLCADAVHALARRLE
jgi:nitrogen fixation NifU-like protein